MIVEGIGWSCRGARPPYSLTLNTMQILPMTAESWQAARAVIKDGGLVAFPTDTVYGVACDPYNISAIQKLYEAKSRDHVKALPLLLAGIDEVNKVARTVPEPAQRLGKRFWPGGLTLVVPRKPDLPDALGGGDTIAVRVPNHAQLQVFLASCGGALAASSANLSGQPDATTAQQAAQYLGGHVDIVIDGGPTPGSIPSTVVDCTQIPPAILRAGVISRETIQQVMARNASWLYKIERILIVTALLVVGLALVLILGKGVASTSNGQLAAVLWLTAFALVVTAVAGALWAGRVVEPSSMPVPVPRLPMLKASVDVIVPGMLALGFVVFLQLFDNGVLQAAIVLVAGFAFAGVLWAQAHTRDATNRYFALAQTVLIVVSHLTAFMLFSVIYGLKVRALFSSTAVAIVTALLLFELLSRDAAWHQAMNSPVEGRRATTGLLSLAGGFIAGELTWGLNYWAALSTLVGGAFLLLVFYVIHGLAGHYVDHKLTRQVLIEFSVVSILGALAIFASAFLL